MEIMANAFSPVIKEHMEGVYSATLPIAGMVWIETGNGAVLIDTLLNVAAAEKIVSHIKEPVKYIIYTHGHADHVGGTKAFIKDNPTILANIFLPDRFDRYRFLQPYRNLISAMQFNIPLKAFGESLKSYIYPTETFSNDYTFKLGDKTFECHSARAETDDTVWVYIPEINTACIGDLMIGTMFPNVGNPWKPTRFALDWAKELEKIRTLAPEYIFCNGGGYVFKGESVFEALDANIEVIRSLHDQVVKYINENVHISEMIHKVKVPDHLKNSKYLNQLYSRPEFFVFNLYRWYHGYYDHNPAHLIPRPEKEVMGEIFELIGDSDTILQRSKALLKQGNPQLALEVLDILLQAKPENIDAIELKMEILKALVKDDYCLMSRNAYLFHINQDKKKIRELLRKKSITPP